VVEAHEAQQGLRWFLAEPLKPPRPFSGCCAGYRAKIQNSPAVRLADDGLASFVRRLTRLDGSR
jgi:hypothetical protein